MDLLKTFSDNKNQNQQQNGCSKRVIHDDDEEDNVELSLGLSSNGQFGVNKYNNNNNDGLVRCSSVSSFSFSSLTSETDGYGYNNNHLFPTSWTLSNNNNYYYSYDNKNSNNNNNYQPLTRTCSLPVETELEWKKRKELQTMRRSEAKRKRDEKMKNGKVVVGLPEENCEVKRRRELPPIPRPAVGPAQGVGSPASGGSSGVSDLESQPFSGGANKDTELKSTATQEPVPVPHQISRSIPYRTTSIPSKPTSSQTTNGNLYSKDETLRMMFADMPCVTTKGEGVNGKNIEGFLYRYRKGEEVRIVCVCHGSFLTPAEFVKHGGGGDVENPLRHIVVIPPAL